jgi:hypothetical protein
MARKKKQSKKTRSRASVVRQDYRKGGRVGLAHGAFPKREEYIDPYGPEDSGDTGEYARAKNAWYAAKAAHEEADRLAKLNEPPKETETDVSGTTGFTETTDLTEGPAPGTGASAPPAEAQDQPKKPNVKDYPVYELDENGNTKLDDEGNPIPKLNEEGNPVFDEEKLKEDQIKYQKAIASWRRDEALRRAKLYGQDGTTSATISEKIGTFGGSVTTPKAEVATLTPEEGITATEDVQQVEDYQDIQAPQGVTIEQMRAAQGNVDTSNLPEGFDPATYAADLAEELDKIAPAQTAELREARADEIRALTEKAVAAERDEDAETKAKATDVPAIISDGAFVADVEGVGGQVSQTADAEVQTRTAITGAAPTGQEAQIVNTLGFEAAQRSAVQGTERTAAAASMLSQTGAIPEDIATAIVEDPATMEAQIASEDVTVQAAVAALPTEALMSAQMEALVGGLESGEIPAWAKPAVDVISQNMVQRGLDVSTVARDSLFNAIIQSALPIAQDNAQALQARAAQNLSNQQQANLAEAQQEQQLRMQNLANRQDAASQTAQRAQQMGVQQGQFRQEAALTTAQQQQQSRLQNLQNQQQAAVLNAQNQQAIAVQNLNVGVQSDLANLQIRSETARENMSAEQQGRLLEYQTATQFMTQNAAFTQEMNRANLSSQQQIQLANLTALNQASSENLSAEQQTELANLNNRMQMNLRNAELAQQMGVAQLNVDQQRAMQNASMVAGMDMSKFNNAQQVELANSKFMQTMTMTSFNANQQAAIQNATSLASLDLATADQRTKLTIENARNFLQTNMANLNNRQQSVVLDTQLKQQRMLSDQAARNAAEQFNSTSENQTNQYLSSLAANMAQFNSQQTNAMEQFNTTETNKISAIEAGNELEADKFNNELSARIDQFNEQADFQRDQWNAANAQAVEQSNVSWRRQANTIDTAAKNAANQQNSANAFNLTRDAQNALWQELRDKATFDYQGQQNQLDRLSRLIATALSHESVNASQDLGLGSGSLAEMFDMLID